MSTYEVVVHDGPDKAELARAADTHAHLPLHTDEGEFEVQVDAIEDLDQGIPDVAIRGHITSGTLKGRSFIGTYDPMSHKGSLHLENAP